MGTTKREMIHLLRQMGDCDNVVKGLQAQNEYLKKVLRDITLPSFGIDTSLRGGVSTDRIGAEVVKRDDIYAEIQQNEKEIRNYLCKSAELERLMYRVLTADERTVLFARYIDCLPWDRVERKAKVSRSGCFRLEAEGLRKLCDEWEKCKSLKGDF